MKITRLSIIFLFFCISVNAEDYVIEEVTFTSHSVELSGSIVFPADGELHSANVFVHGSGRQKRSLNLAKYLAKRGIVTLVYDKRGVGLSGGKYENEQGVSGDNIALLADDANAALRKLSQHNKVKGLQLGLTGISQAGWIVPVAAERSELVDYMVLWSGPVCKVSEEDIFSKYTANADAKNIPSYAEALASRKAPYIWPDFLGVDTDPMTSLKKLDIPGLWVFGKNDGSVPADLSIHRLGQQIEAGKPYEYVLFSSSGHNNIPETIDTVVSWIKRLDK
jgi:pimeloyl-ACP methyl ester carboxylesterase